MSSTVHPVSSAREYARLCGHRHCFPTWFQEAKKDGSVADSDVPGPLTEVARAKNGDR